MVVHPTARDHGRGGRARGPNSKRARPWRGRAAARDDRLRRRRSVVERAVGRLAGCEDVNDAEPLRRDPALRWIGGGKGASGCAASASQMGRFETRRLTSERNLLSLAERQPARGPNADRRRNLLIGFTLAGSTFGAYSHKRRLEFGGRSEIRTHGGVASTAVFKTAALNHSAILPAFPSPACGRGHSPSQDGRSSERPFG